MKQLIIPSRCPAIVEFEKVFFTIFVYIWGYMEEGVCEADG